MSIASSVVSIVEAAALEKSAKKVTSVTVDVGDLSGVAAEALSFCYEAATQGTIAAGSALKINKIAPKAVCGECGEEFSPETKFFVCPRCGGFGANLIAGEELSVREMEVE